MQSTSPLLAALCAGRHTQRIVGAVWAAAALLVAPVAASPTPPQDPKPTVEHFSEPRADAPIPRPGMKLEKGKVALVVTDPQNDFLSPQGVAWGVVGQSVTENKTVDNLESLFKVAKNSGIPVFISPHYYYPHDHQWKFEGALEALMHKIGMFDRKGPLHQEGFAGSGADWLDRYKPYINDGKTTVTSPHKVFGPESNDLVLQLRKAGITQVVLGGMSANLCVESHMRELVEQGFNVVVVADATAAAKVPGFDGFEAAFVNYRMIASDVWSTAQAVKSIAKLQGSGALINVSGASNVAVNGYDPVTFFTTSKGVNGSPFITAEHQGATYYFASEENKALFAKAPQSYVAQFGGFCAYGVSINKLLPIDITTAQVRDGKLYFNLNPAVRVKFDADFAGNVAKATANWPGLVAKNLN